MPTKKKAAKKATPVKKSSNKKAAKKATPKVKNKSGETALPKQAWERGEGIALGKDESPQL